jgi:exopolyphosphatase / guanosine-5'-triphosphate,3'-diphosphate pyrophosphatase
MIPLLFLMLLIFPFPALSADTGRVCAIDMGSNSLKLILGEMKGGEYVQHHFTKNRLGVGDDMSTTGVISPPKLSEIRQTLEKYLAVCDSNGIRLRSAVATAAFREAKNQGEVVEIAKSLNLPLEIASEERESKLAYLVGTLGQQNFAVIDNGSRTIELVTSSASGYRWSVFHLGFRIAFQQFFQPARTFAEANDRYRQALAPNLLSAGFMKGRAGYAGVEMEAAARYVLSQHRVDGVWISLDTVSRKIAELRAMAEDEFSRLKKVKEIDEILPRLVVLEQTLITFGYREIRVFERELGVGLIVEKGIQLK